jgi:hypothetical protein
LRSAGPGHRDDEEQRSRQHVEKELRHRRDEALNTAVELRHALPGEAASPVPLFGVIPF